MTKLVILGRKSKTGNYEAFFRALPAQIVTTLVPGEVITCDALILRAAEISLLLFSVKKTKVPALLTPNWTSCNSRLST